MATYRLHYWPGIPGRGEYVRLAFEATGTPYAESTDVKVLMKHVMTPSLVGHPPHFAPPILEITPDSSTGGKRAKTKEGQSAKDVGVKSSYVSQTPAILAYLGPKLGLVGDEEGDDEEEREIRRAQVNQLTLTALDLSNESHDVHHPVASSLYYEDQKAESLRRANDFRRERVPKFFKHFEQVLASNPAKSNRLIGKNTTTADLVLFHVIDGLQYAFPRLLASLQNGGEYSNLFEFKKSVGEEEKLKAYLSSDRCQKYSMGLFRHYPELDGEK